MEARLTRILIMLVAPVLVACNCDDVTYLANNLDVQYSVLDNLQDTWITFSSRLTLRNTGDRAIAEGAHNWELYMFNIRVMQPKELKPDIVPKPEGVPFGDGSSGLWLYHVQSTLYRLVPSSNFVGISSQGSLTVVFNASDWQVSVTDSMPNWYIANDVDGCTPKTIQSTTGEDMHYVGPFTEREQYKRIHDDLYDPYTLEQRYERFDMTDDGQAPLRVLPTPMQQNLNANERLSLQGWVVSTSGAQNEAKYLADKLGSQVVNPAPDSQVIRVNSGPIPEFTADCRENLEAYKLTVSAEDEIITIESETTQGAFWGVQTLLSLASDGLGVPTGEVQDCPRFPWRGMFADVSRNFHGKDTILKLLDAMATYKLNKFHFHLCDDEGWRLAIPGLEELTEVASRRCHDPVGDECLVPQLGSGPTVGTSGSGYYTVEEYQEILQYAQDRHIEVIPEFDMPGHSHAAINAMEARYRKYEIDDPAEAERYRLFDHNDTSEYFSIQAYTDNSVNPCIESTYNFIEKVMMDVQTMHAGIQPLRVYHFGGDEVPHTAWLDSPACQTLGVGNTTKTIKGYFVGRTAGIAKNLNLKLAGWEDGYTDEEDLPFNVSMFGDEVFANVWNNIWEWGLGRHAYELANAGYKVILSPVTHTYFDHPTEPDPTERGYYWGPRFADVHKTFGYLPDDVYRNMDDDVTRMGAELNREEICADYRCPELEQPENVIGLQGQIWCETVRTAAQFEEMVFPRLLALAERAWHKAPWEDVTDKAQRDQQRTEDWEEFAHVLGYRELSRLDDMGVRYHVRPPGFRNPDTSLSMRGNSEFPGQPLQVSADGGVSWMDYRENMPAEERTTYTVRTSSNDRRRSSRAYQLTFPEVSGASLTTAMAMTILLPLLLMALSN